MSMVGFAGSEMVLTCVTTNAPTVTWKVNGTYLIRPCMVNHIDPKLPGGIDITH